MNERIEQDNAIPGNGFFKDFESRAFGFQNGYDYLNAQGYFGVNISSNIGLQLGHGRHFIGEGIRSVFLSDFSNNYFYLKLNTRVWKLHLQNIFAELSSNSPNAKAGDLLLPKKYLAAHYLSFKASPVFTFGIYEAIVFSRNNQFELQYLNPVIFYRAVEQMVGSPDNITLGFSAKLNLLKRFQLYGQFLFDEFKYDELLIERRGWWGNKFALQGGIKYFNALGIDHLDVQIEANVVRPYTYSHRDSAANYSHDHQPLAHPLGANFQEIIAQFRYQPFPKWVFHGRLMYAEVGEDEPENNWGSNILTPNTSRVRDFDNNIGQGVSADIQLARLEITYQLFHNGFLALEGFYRKKDSIDNERDLETFYVGGRFSLNFPSRRMDF